MNPLALVITLAVVYVGAFAFLVGALAIADLIARRIRGRHRTTD